VGNEAGIADLPTWNTAMGIRLSVNTEGDQPVGEHPLWLPAECDCMMRWHCWFYEEADVDTVKPLDELMGLYYLSVGRGANLLINIGPDRRGLLPDADREALLAFGQEVRRRFAQPLARLGDGKLTATGWEYTAKEPFYLDHVAIQEDLTAGEHVRRFAIRIQTGISGRMVTLHEGRNIGHKAICRLPLVACRKVVIEITESDGPAVLREVALFNTTGLVHRH
jgi:alpha-L-fucosidase